MFSIFNKVLNKKPVSPISTSKCYTKFVGKAKLKQGEPSQILLDWVRSKPAVKFTDKFPDQHEVVDENHSENSMIVKEEEDHSKPLLTFQPMVSPREGSESALNEKNTEKVAKKKGKRATKKMRIKQVERMIKRRQMLRLAERGRQERSEDETLRREENREERNKRKNEVEVEELPQISHEDEDEKQAKLFAARRSKRLSICVEFTKDLESNEIKMPFDQNNAVKPKRICTKKVRCTSHEQNMKEVTKHKHSLEKDNMEATVDTIPSTISVHEADKKVKRKKLDSTIVEKTEEVIDEIIEEIWHVSLKMVDKEPVAMFLVKWEGFPPESNTLEPYEHVQHADCVKDFVNRKYELHEDKFEEAIESLLSECKEHQEIYFKKPKSFILAKLSKFDVLRFKCNIFAYIYTYNKLPNTYNFLRNLRYHSLLYKFYLKIEKEKAINQLFIDEILSKENNSLKVVVENVIDFETIPKFEYLRNVSGCNGFKTDVNSGCECKDGCNKSSDCCPEQMGLEHVYDNDGRICARSHQMIVECNEFCKCDLACPNRPKQLSISFRVFKSADRGWALKTMQNIPTGTFVIEYTGELIDETEAKKRSKIYDKTGLNYLFDLDYNEAGEAPYSIDATFKGNLSRFINHSCEANLQTWPAITCNENSRTHRLYYFSLRPIRAGEELTVDYCGGVHPNFLPSRQDNAVTCKCGSPLCKGYIF